MLSYNYIRLCNKVIWKSFNDVKFAFRYCTQFCAFSSDAKVIKESGSKPSWINYAHAKQGNFIQEWPRLDNPYFNDLPLQRFLLRHIPRELLHEITEDLIQFSDKVVKYIHKLGRECELHAPRLIGQNAWGERIDELWTCSAWQKQHDICAEEGLVAIGYERKHREWSRLYQLSKLYLYAPAAGLYTCPLAMADGAAKTIEILGSENPVFQQAYSKLTSRDPKKFWTSGQWMTERQGGSDVAGGTETVAIPHIDHLYHLYGYKWFSSATDSDMALTLARISDENGSVKSGTKGLTLFFLETRKPCGSLNNIHVVRLKDKLGTHQVPTAELLLDGTMAYKMSEEGKGMTVMANMLTMTRIHNAAASVAAMRCILRLARDYSQRRMAFGQLIGKYPLHMQTLARMEVEVRGSLLLFFKVALWLGKVECGVATDEEFLLLRLMTPILKLYTAKQAMSVVSEGLEAFGGQGYMEDTGLPSLLRDCQVLPIWEGTTNILSLDALRSIAKTNGEVLNAFRTSVNSCVEMGKHVVALRESCEKVHKASEYILTFMEEYPEKMQMASRDLAYSIARTYIGALLLDNASWSNCTKEDIITAQRWCLMQDLCPLNSQEQLRNYSKEAADNDLSIVMEGYRKL